MIFEMRTYLMKPGSIPKVEELFGAGMPARTKLSRFGGFWRTEVGQLNQIIHAAAALLQAAAIARAHQAEVIAQDIEQRRCLRSVDALRLAVDCEGNGHPVLPLTGPYRRSATALR